MAKSSSYRGRLAPSPTGYLHLGHARTFWVAWQRARAAHGKLVFRNEDLDYQRCKPEFVHAMYEDLRWLGLDWDEGPDLSFQAGKSDQFGEPDLGGTVSDVGNRCGSVSHGEPGRGDFGPYSQSERRSFYLDAWRKLRDSGLIYPCTCSRKDLERVLSAPHEEPRHTDNCGPQAPSPAEKDLWEAQSEMATRAGVESPSSVSSTDSSSQPGAPPPHLAQNRRGLGTPAAAVQFPIEGPSSQSPAAAVHSPTDDELPYPGTCREKIGTAKDYDSPAGVSWRFKVPDGETIGFDDGHFGRQEFVAGRDFADFLLWRRDDIPAYQLAVVVDDAAMQITEVVRGADLLKSTARQLLLIRALGYQVPAYFHCPLLRDEQNIRLAKRHDALSLRNLREQGVKAEALRKKFASELTGVG
jgi:glutamyl-tRNA synthetase